MSYYARQAAWWQQYAALQHKKYMLCMEHKQHERASYYLRLHRVYAGTAMDYLELALAKIEPPSDKR